MIGISSISFFNMNLIEALLEAARYEVDHIEIVAEFPHCYPPKIDASQRRQILKIAQEFDIKFGVHAPFVDLNVAHINPNLRASSMPQIEEALKFARDIGAEYAVVHPGEIPRVVRNYLEIPTEQYRDFIERLMITIGNEIPADLKLRECSDFRELFHLYSIHSILKMKENTGFDAVCIENLSNPYSLCKTAEEHAQHLKYFEGCFDVGHANVASNPFEHAKAVKKRIKCIHIHDNSGQYDEHSPLGKGKINFEAIIEVLGRDKLYTFEALPMNVESLAQSLPVLRQLLANAERSRRP